VAIREYSCVPLSKSKREFRLKIDGPSLGPVVGVAFGCAWGVAGASALPRPWLPNASDWIHCRLYFLGLWKATDLRVFVWTALAMCIVCGLAAFLPGATENGDVNVRQAVAGLGSALVL
jgi:hypothetical protein